MKKLVKTVQDIIKTMGDAARKAVQKFAAKILVKQEAARLKLAESRGDFVMEHAVVWVIILVLAAVVIIVLRAFVKDDMNPLLTGKIKDFFN